MTDVHKLRTMFHYKFLIINFVFLCFFGSHYVMSELELPPPFPLHDCKEADIDLVVMIEPWLNYTRNFISNIAKVFLKHGEKELIRLRVALVILEDSSRVRLEFSFHDYVHIQDLEHNMIDFHSSDPTDYFSKYPVLFDNAGGRENATKIVFAVSTKEVGLPASSNEDVLVFWMKHNRNGDEIPYYSTPEISLRGLDELNSPLISMWLCGECSGHGWFKLEHHQKHHLVSCYHLLHHHDTTHWLQGQSYCEDLGTPAGLVSIETGEELRFFQESLYKAVHSDKYASQKKTYINIGIRRNETALDKRFTWINGNPLILRHWMTGGPRGGISSGCGVWAFQKMSSDKVDGSFSLGNSAKKVPFDHYRKLSLDGWMAVGCGMALGNMSLCEIVLRRSRQDKRFLGNISPTDHDQGLIDTVLYNDFTLFSQRLVSVGAYLSDPEFRDWYESENGGVKMFDCGDNDSNGVRYISFSYVCDYVQHCKDGRDERFCQSGWCPREQFRCNSGQCVHNSQRCDFYPDCADASDEEGCSICRGKRCCDGTCLPRHLFHDGEEDCSCCTSHITGYTDHDESFQSLAGGPKNEMCAFICNYDECIYPSQLNDGTIDCKGPEGPLDERLGKLETSQACFNNTGQLIWAPRCVYIKDRYNHALGCRDMSHLLHCDDFECPMAYFKCPKSYCIPNHHVRDAIYDCPMGEDENAVEPSNCTGNFACWNSHMCLHPDLVCDQHKHCPAGDDELNCKTSCMAGFHCVAGAVTVLNYNTSVPLQTLAFIDLRTKYIDLSGVDLSGVDLSGVDLSGVDAIKLLKDWNSTLLYEVRLSSCKIRNTTSILLAMCKSCAWLVHLDVSHNHIQSFDSWVFLFVLDVLNVSFNSNLTTINFYSIDMTLLRVLDLSYTSVDHLQFPSGYKQFRLEHLNLSHTKITAVSDFLVNVSLILQTLSLLSTPVTGFFPGSFDGLQIQSGLYTDNFRLCCPQVRGSGIPAHACHAPQDAISSCFDLVREPVQRVLLWTVGVVAVLGNCLVIIFRLVWDRTILKRGYGLFVTNLAFADLGIYLLIIATADGRFRGRYVWEESNWKDSVACQTAYFLSTLSSETSTFFIFLITTDRFLVIRFPFGQVQISKLGIAIATALAWILGVALAVVPVLPLFRHWNIYRSNGMCLGLPLSGDHSAGWQYSFSVFIILNFAMFTAIALGQYAIYKAMSASRFSKSSKMTAQARVRRAQNIVVAKQLSLIAVTDFLCWFPIGVMGLMAVAGYEISNEAYAWSAILVLPVNSALNPMLYTVPLLFAKWEEFKTGEGRCQRV